LNGVITATVMSVTHMPSLKSLSQKLLKQMHLYERAKASYLYDLFWRVADKRIIEARNCEIEFYRNLLSGFCKGDLVFDVGANHGAKTEVFLQLGAKVVAVDPDKANQAILEEKFLKYRLTKKPVFIVGKAVSDKNGLETFWVDEPGSGKNTLNQKWVQTLRNDPDRFGEALRFKDTIQVETLTLETLISTYGRPFFVKIDIEGHELNVLKGLQHPVPYLSFEVNLPEFREEGLQCLEQLKRLDPRGDFNYTVDSQTKLARDDWMSAEDFQRILKDSEESSIEVFWKTVNQVQAGVTTSVGNFL
jgi:FkbM family methyltransferase